MYSGGSTNNRPVGSTATHSCDNGYRLVGGITIGLVGVMECGVCQLQCVSVSGMDFVLLVYRSPMHTVNCSDLPSLTNGMIMYSAGSTNIEHASFTPLVVSATGGLGNEAKTFYKRLASLLASNPYNKTMCWLRCRLSFSPEISDNVYQRREILMWTRSEDPNRSGPSYNGV